VLRCISYPLDAQEPISFHHSLSPEATTEITRSGQGGKHEMQPKLNKSTL